MSPCNIIMWGGTGQAIVNREIIELRGGRLIALFDDTPGLVSPFNDVTIYEGWKQFNEWKIGRDLTSIGFCIAIGNPHGNVRLQIAAKLKSYGLHPITLLHPSAIISAKCRIGAGSQVMAGAVIQSDARIGEHCIINTKASVDHECLLADGCEVGPGATLCGNIRMMQNAWVCAGATVLPRLTIGENTIIGAGSLLTKNADANKILYGVPANIVREIK